MTNTDIEQLEFKLQAKRQELIARISGGARELNVGGGEPDMIDRMQSMAHRDKTAAMLSRLSSTLAEIDRALRAISEGEYGVCADCGEPIALKRLQVMPWATYCLPCQEHSEMEQNLWRGAAA
jgi:DnaK suppressor protein